MVVEQIVFAVLMIGVADVLTNDHMRAAFMSPSRRAELREELGGGAADAAPGSQPNPSSPA
jgi:hypothetical protein